MKKVIYFDKNSATDILLKEHGDKIISEESSK